MKNIFFLSLGIVTLLFTPKAYTEEQAERPLKVAILGTGKKAGEREYYDLDMLGKLLDQIKLEKPDMVLFNGDLIQGLEQSTSAASIRELKNNLSAFSSVVKNHLGNEIPLYPIMGNHTFVNSEAVSIFKNHFNIKESAPLEPYQIAYSLTIKNVKFILLATGLYETKFRSYGAISNSMPILDWLEKSVRTGPEEVNYRFIIGHEPAYSPTASEGIYSGLDQMTEIRNRFWSILTSNKVLAYFCSHELLYDRSYHKGAWQVISGGLGDPIRLKDEENMFRHFILLTIPSNTDENPTVAATDINGRVWDKLKMNPAGEAVNHLRISQN